MSEFCVKCSEKEAQMELLYKQLHEVKQENEKLRNEVEALVMDVAFYSKDLSNLTFNQR